MSRTSIVPGMTEPEREPLSADQIFDAIVGPYYARAVAIGDSAFDRMHAAYAAGCGFAAAALGVIAANWSTSEVFITKLAGCVAAAAWLLATALYVGSLTGRTEDAPPAATSKGSFVTAVVERSTAERERVEEASSRANKIAALALLCTAVTFGLAVMLSPRSDPRPVRVALTPSGSKTFSSVCDLWRGGMLVGTTHSKLTGADAVSLRVAATNCARDEVELVIPRGAIEAIIITRP